MAETFSHNETHVSMSPATAAHYGEWTQEFPIWAETQNIQNVIIITPEDILQGRDPSELSSEDRHEALKTFIEENFPDFPIEQFEDELESLGKNAALGQGRAESRDLDSDGTNDVGIVIAPRRAQTKEEAATRLGGIEPTEVENIKGTDIEWQIMTVAHEIGHLDQPGKSSGMSLVWEVEAEQNMVNLMVSAQEKGLLSDPALLDNFTAIRNLKSFFFKSDLYTHVVSAGVQTPSEGSAPVASEDSDLADPLHEALMLTAYEIGNDLINNEHKIDELERMWAERGPYSFDSHKLPETTIDDRKTMLAVIDGEISLQDGLEQLPDNIRQKIEENFEDKKYTIGIGTLRQDPALMYETTRNLYQNGAFDDNPIGKQYAYEFLETAKTYAPEYFGVANTNETFEPPTFPHSDQSTPIIHHDHGQTFTQSP